VFVTLLEATGINLNVYVVVGCVGGVVCRPVEFA